MPEAAFFLQFGLFAEPQFLEAPVCDQIRTEIRAADKVPATVLEEGDRYGVDTRFRSTDRAKVAPDTETLIQERLLSVMPRVGSHFGLQLERIQPLQFLVYGYGDHFSPHSDRDDHADGAAFSRSRQVSVVLFLNDQSDVPGPDNYSGGELAFYGLLDDERARAVGFPLRGQVGLLIAFLPDTVHGVTPVTAGERYTVVTWFE